MENSEGVGRECSPGEGEPISNILTCSPQREEEERPAGRRETAWEVLWVVNVRCVPSHA